MIYIILIGLAIIGLIGFITAAKYATKSNYSRDYIKVYIFWALAVASIGALFFV